MYRQFGNASFLQANAKIAKSDYQLLSVCPSIRPAVQIEHLGSHRTDFHGILYLGTFLKSVDKIIDSLKSDRNNGYLT